MDKFEEIVILGVKPFYYVLKGNKIDGFEELLGPAVFSTEIVKVIWNGGSITDLLTKMPRDGRSLYIYMCCNRGNEGRSWLVTSKILLKVAGIFISKNVPLGFIR